MNIWIIGRGYPTPSNKMWGSFELEQARLLARDGNQVSYIALTLSFFSRSDPRGTRAFEEDGVHIYAQSRLYFPGKAGIYLERFEDRCWRQLFLIAEKEHGRPDIIHIHYPSMISSINETERYRMQGVRIFVTEHWSRVLKNDLRSFEMHRLAYYASHAERFACVSSQLQEAVGKLTDVSVPTEIIPNIVSPVFFNEKRSDRTKSGFVFAAVGRLVPLKRFDVIISEFLKAFSPADNVRLTVIGSGPERKKLEKLIGNDPRIELKGHLSLQETANELSAADALVSFSEYETFAVPVAEAWACGKPVIVSDKTGIISYMSDERGFVVPADRQDMLGAAMRDIYSCYEMYDPGRIRAFCRENFDDKSILSRLYAMYAGKANGKCP